jgi:hypothetical protein
MSRAARAALLFTALLSLAACGGGGGDGEADDDTAEITDPPGNPTPPNPPNRPPPTQGPGTGSGNPPSNPGDPNDPGDPPGNDPPDGRGFTTVSNDVWDETAVRKVLHIFALGGQATDEQIGIWADLPPETAIQQMLTFDEHNARLSPVGPTDTDRLDLRDGTLHGLAEFWSSDDPANRVPEARRDKYRISSELANVWTKAATSRGLNPFRHRIGLWETNQHLAVNLAAGVGAYQIARYYEDILAGLADDEPYENVLTTAALSAAVATQYGHRTNRYVNGVCECNEDFAREYFQLFFGILGEADPSYHETVSIKHMAAALTDMTVPLDGTRLADYVVFGTDEHYPAPLEIMEESIYGSTAADRVAALSPRAIVHPESLDALPVKIVSELADDAMTDGKARVIREAWADMPQKSLLGFLRAYAVSTLFHSSSRLKYWNSPERYLIVTNRVMATNEENDLNAYRVDAFEAEGVTIFEPVHNVFGSQTGREAADSADVFRAQLNAMMDDEWLYRRGEAELSGIQWTKDWSDLVPRSDGGYVVRDVAEWLWQRFVADGLRNFGTLERAYLYALLATDSDFGELAAPGDADHVYTVEELEEDPALTMLIDGLAASRMNLASADARDRLVAHERLGQAIDFIAATPYVFAQEGR